MLKDIKQSEIDKIQQLAEAFGESGVTVGVSFSIRVFDGKAQFLMNALEQISLRYGAHLLDWDVIQDTENATIYEFTLLATNPRLSAVARARLITWQRLHELVERTFGGESDNWELDVKSVYTSRIRWRKE